MPLNPVRRLVALAVLAAVLGATAAICLPALTDVPDAAALPSVNTAVKKALKYFKSRQTKAGGFTTKGMTQAHITPWVVVAIRAAGQNPAKWRKKGGKTPVQYMQRVDIQQLATGSSATENPAATYSKFILAYKAARRTALIQRAGAKRIDLVDKLLAYQNPSNGRFTTSTGGSGTYAAISTTTYAILALKASGRASGARTKAVRWLQGQASSDGGFSWYPGGRSDVDSTGAVIQALRAGGVSASSSVIRKALKYIRSKQQRDGGFAYDFGGSTTSSTSIAIQGIVAARQSPTSSSWRKRGKTPIRYLLGMQAKNGSFYHLGRLTATPLLSTAHAVMGLRKKPLPL